MTQQLSLRGSGLVDRDLLQEYVGALQLVTSIRGILFLILLLCLLVPLGVYSAVSLGWVSAAATVSAEESLEAAETTGVSEEPSKFSRCAPASMHLAAFLARCAAVLLAVTYLLAANVCIVGRISGGKDALSAFFWIVVLLVFLVPWHAWLGGINAPLMFYDVHELVATDAALPQLIEETEGSAAQWMQRLSHYATFFLLPCMGLLTAAVADIRFGQFYRHSMQRVRRMLEGEIQ